MTRITKTSVVKVLVMTLLLTTASFAGSKNESVESAKVKKMVGTLLNGINSENDGLKKSSIYFAGKYKIEEAVDVLTAQLSKEDDPATRILIALSLYSIGSPEGMNVVKARSEVDTDSKVRRMCSAIYETYAMDEIKAFYTINK